MRKIKIDKDFTLTDELLLDLIDLHIKEKSRLNKLLRYYNNKNDKIKLSVSVTTRKPRNGEVHGVNYFFLEKTNRITLFV